MNRPAGDDAQVPCLISALELEQRVSELGAQLTAAYAQRNPILVGVLSGAWVFMADLVRQMRVPLRCDFVRLASYGSATRSSGQVELVADMRMAAQGEHLLIVEDIIDTGTSLAWLRDHLQSRAPANIEVCTLLDKPARREVDVKVDYVGFSIPDHFVVGYGIDWDQRYRELPYIGYIRGEGEGP